MGRVLSPTKIKKVFTCSLPLNIPEVKHDVKGAREEYSAPSCLQTETEITTNKKNFAVVILEHKLDIKINRNRVPPSR